eukprot:gene7499-644_t
MFKHRRPAPITAQRALRHGPRSPPALAPRGPPPALQAKPIHDATEQPTQRYSP